MHKITQNALTLASMIFLLTGVVRAVEPPSRETARLSAAQQNQQDVRELGTDAPLEREMAGAEVHLYRIEVAAGQYLHVTIEQRGIDIVGLLRGADGVPILEMDGLTGLLGAEELSWEAAMGGLYTLEVRAKSRQANAGRYEVKLERAPAATDKDRARIAAERLYMEGRRAQDEGRGEALERAIKSYTEAVEKWRAVGERKWEGQSLNNLGNVLERMGQYERARDYYERALPIMREVRDSGGEASALLSVASFEPCLATTRR